MTFARDERAALSARFEESGPDAPTLCDGWQTRDLAAHLVLRERRPDAALGIVGRPLAGYTKRVQEGLAARTPYPRLIELIRTGPPSASIFRLPWLDDQVNTVEFFVHHEDVRRAADGWKPRELSPGLTDSLWRRLRGAKLLFRRAPVGVELVRDDLPAGASSPQVRITARARTPVVTITGHPAELTLWAMGRTTAAQVRIDGGEREVRTLTQTMWRP
ncbi:MAG TPA: TIGR03085 family metal-binding protein [Streptosporangiaceae bacterium]